MSVNFSTDEDFARQLDSEDPLRHFREKFYLPLDKDGQPLIYFAGNSLGLMPRSARELVDEELDNWAKRSEEHTSELHHSQISYAVFCLKKKKKTTSRSSSNT